MPKWTEEQLKAINETGKNIIVSAGAGSGKTAVLTERVITKLNSGIKINELLVLTFTNAAAKEMKERIRKKINENTNLLENLDYLDASYITTFDSFSLSLVKKYSYILNVSSNLKIVDDGIISIYKKKLLDKIFDDYYLNPSDSFNKLINDFAIKNDTSIKESILSLISSLDYVIDKGEFLDNYFNNYYSEDKINDYLNKYNELLLKEIYNIESNLMYINELGYSDYSDSLYKSFDKLIKAKNYDEIKLNINVSIPRRPKDSDDVIIYKDSISESLKKIKNYLRFKDSNEIVETLNISKEYLKCIIDIIKKYNEELNIYKFENDLYEFTDIELLAIKLLKENKSIKEEIKNYYKEILVDEYQDTNDLQEEFINLIGNNNIYMVGDIKQSIYGFRNANPSIFKEKYDKYSKNIDGIKIDLVKNFRSRREVIDIINKIFSLIMDDNIGGCNYVESHQMIFGNTLYDEKKSNTNYDLEIYNYNYEDKYFTKEEIEAFIIGKDIKEKIKNKYQVIDKNTFELRCVRYEDFCIIMDRGVSFPIIKKIFEYLQIPSYIYQDKKLNSENDFMIIKNIIELLIKIKEGEFDNYFKYSFISIARSYLFELNDDEIFLIFKNNDYANTDIYKKCEKILNSINLYDSYELLVEIINTFNFYEKIIKKGNVNGTLKVIDNLYDVASNLSKLGYSIIDFKDYLNDLIENKKEITYKGDNVSSNAVKIMNIHKSKGLEFPICYFLGLYKEFNTMDIKARFVYDENYGLITPYFKDGVDNTILKDLLKNKYKINDISEKIRLFYVALTRCKEKMIIVTSLDNDKKTVNNKVSDNIRNKYNSFLAFLNSINGNLNNYIKNINLNDYDLTKDYMYKLDVIKDDYNVSDKKIEFKRINLNNDLVDELHASKEVNELLSSDEINKMKYGTIIHKYLEEKDFFNIDESDEHYDLIKNLKESLNITNNTKMLKEYEFVYEKNNSSYHGIIDLLLIDEEVIKIVDYKLKNIDDPKYIEQLKVYYDYINSIFDKKIEVYLYSIIDNKLKIINL